MDFLSILVALVVFLVVVLFHEGGHFLAAKAVGIRVNEFAVGMGPAILRSQRGETQYSLRLLPIGGYCAMEGEDDASDDPRSYDSAKPWQRFITILAGPMMNLVIAVLFFSIFNGMLGRGTTTVDTVVPESGFAEAGLQPGDTIQMLDGQNVDSLQEIRAHLAKSEGSPIEVIYTRDGVKQTPVRIAPVQQEGRWVFGFTAKTQSNVLWAIEDGVAMTGHLFGELFDVFARLLTGRLSLQAVSGPVGVVSAIGQATKQGFSSVLFFSAYISLNLAFFNLLPIPALDGSKLLFIIIEKLRGKAMKKELETRITTIGFLFLMGLILLVSVKDVIGLFR